jgi:hypothetical protein
MRPKIALPLVVFLFIASISVSYWVGASRTGAQLGPAVAYTQAQLAFGHYKSYERIESLLERTCFAAAKIEVEGLKNVQLALIADSLPRAGNDQELMEYMKLRDPKVVETLLLGKVPALKSYTTTCP